MICFKDLLLNKWAKLKEAVGSHYNRIHRNRCLFFLLKPKILAIFLLLILLFPLAFHFFVPKTSAKIFYRPLKKMAISNIFMPRNDLLENINLDYKKIISGKMKDYEIEYFTKNWKYETPVEDIILNSTDKCGKIKELFLFNQRALSREEANFPLSYGLLVYKEPAQFLYMLDSFYHPQNLYCIAIPENGNEKLKLIVQILPTCFENIYIMNRPHISWGSYEILNSTYKCFEYLTRADHNWKYYQYLAGVDVPLKTNLEMVKIFKALKGEPNIDAFKLEEERIPKNKKPFAPLPIIKSSLSALIPRKLANFLVDSPMTLKVLTFLEDTQIADESFWGTMIGNNKTFPVPGGFDAELLIEAKREVSTMYRKARERQIRWCYYISREQIWESDLTVPCNGMIKSESCVFGVLDVQSLMIQPALVGHKLYMDVQPAALFAIFKEIRRRTFNPEPFNTSRYSELPQYELLRGVPVEKILHPSWLLH